MMNWLFGPRATRDTLHIALRPEAVPNNATSYALEAGKHYVSITLRALRLAAVTQGFSRFHGVVHSFASLPSPATPNGTADFHKIASPDKLKNLDANNVDLVLQKDVPLLGPVPYIGGKLSIEIGLLAVKSTDLAAPYVALLERLSTIAGVSVIGAAAKFVEPLREGVSLLTGTSGAASLEVGLSQSMGPPMTGWFVLLRAPRDKFAAGDLTVDPYNYQLVDKKGDPILDHSYMIISVEGEEVRTDYVQIDDVRRAMEELRTALAGGRAGQDDLLAAFKRITLNSPDLLRKDAERIVRETTRQFGLDGKAAAVAETVGREPPSSIGILETIESASRGSRAAYRRSDALAYARNYWKQPASDNYIAIKSSPFYRSVPDGTVFKQVYAGGQCTDEYAELPDGSKILWPELEDCTHFVSCCLGVPPNGSAGGLPIRRDFNTIYGRLSPQRLFDDLINDQLVDLVCTQVDHATAAQKLAQLQQGDLIFYWHPESGRYRHVGLYLAGGERRIACHTYCRCDVESNYNQTWDSTEFRYYTLVKVR